MTDRVYEILCEMKKCCCPMPEECVDDKKNFVFHTLSGKLIKTTNFGHELKKVVETYNETAKHPIEGLTCHVLRHTGCTRNAEKGMDMKVLQYMMGHANSNITNNVYNHVNEERAQNELLYVEKHWKDKA